MKTNLYSFVISLMSVLTLGCDGSTQLSTQVKQEVVYTIPTNEYIVCVDSDVNGVSNQVNFCMKHGYEPIGGFNYGYDAFHCWSIYTQAMIKVKVKGI